MPPSPPMAQARRLRWTGLAILLAILIGPVILAVAFHSSRMHVFSGLQGPETVSRIEYPSPATWLAYRRGGSSRLAILLTNPDSAWLGLVHGLKAHGIPFTITRDVGEALQHRVVLAYPSISGRVLAPDELRALAAHPRQGGTLIAPDVLGGGLHEVFGFASAVPSRSRFEMRFSPAASAWLQLVQPEEQTLALGKPDQGQARLGSTGYVGGRDILAAFEDGSGAIVRKRYESGVAYALGFDPGMLLLTGQTARGQDLAGSYVNAYAPQADIVLRLIGQVWREGEPLAVSMGPVPDGRSLAVILTHDIDYTRSLPNAIAYAELLQSQGVRGTFFVQAKYMRDYNDAIILNDETAGHLKRLAELGMEIASHTVSHSRAFSRFELGSGDERYPDYQPFAEGREEASGGTVLGELRVSKFLLEALAPPSRVVSFRPGHLALPAALPQALAATGYGYSSSATVGMSLSHLPFRLTYDRGAAAPTPIFEFPITVEDELDPPMGSRLPQALAVAASIARHGGLFVVLTHPNILDHKLAFSRGLIAALRETAWFGALADFGTWWASRDAVELDVERRGAELVVSLAGPHAARGLTIKVPTGWVLQTDTLARGRPSQEGQVVVLDLEGRAELVFRDTRRS